MSAKNIDDQNFDDQASDAVDSSFDESYEDDATYSEDDTSGDWSEEGDDAGVTDEDAPQQPQKKKSSVLTVIIILVVAIVGVLGFMVVSGGGVPAPEEQQAQGQAPIDADAESTPMPDVAVAADTTAPAVDAPAPVTAAPDATAVPAEPQQGLMDNPDVLNQPPVAAPTAQPTLTTPQVVPDAAAPVMDAPVDMAAVPDAPAVVPAVPEMADTKTGADVVDVISPNVKPVSDFPSVDSIKKPDADMSVEPAQVMADAVPDAAQADKAAEVQAQLDAAQGKIAELEKNLADKEDELAAQKSKAVEVASDSSSDAEIDTLKSKIAELEDRLAAKAEEKSVVVERTTMADEGDVVTEPKPVKKAVVTAKVPKPVKNLWVLKSASSSKAILSDKSTGDLKTVGVGDVVPALGRIISITNTNSSWVVKGTTGSVSE